jgi:signal transduction histidine kinase
MKHIIFGLLLILPFFGIAQDTVSDQKIKINAVWVEPEVVFHVIDTNKLSTSDIASIESDKKFLNSLPESYENMPQKDMKNLINKLDDQLARLTKEKELLLENHSSQEVIDSKTGVIGVIGKEKKIINLTIEKSKLSEQANVLGMQKEKLKNYLIIAAIILSILILSILVLLQRRMIGVKDKKIESQLDDINKKNNYLEHAARIIRHDMHSGINTYMPRGINSLERRITEDQAKELKIDGSIKMIKEGLAHTQKVYKSVYEFTNLVKPESVFEREESDLKPLLLSYIENTAYSSSVEMEELGKCKVNPYLFCTAIDNLIRNGLKFNDNEKKRVKIFVQNNLLIVEDNGNGLSSEDFEKIKKNKNKKGLGLNIAIAILEEHGFEITCNKLPIAGTQINVKLK